MLVGKPTRSETRRRGVALVALAMAVLPLAGCYQNPDPTEWNAKAKSNFIAGCSTEVTAEGGTTTSIAIESKGTCECIYDLIKAPETGEKGKYPIAWEDLKDYEKKQADAKAGDEPPTPPKQLTKAIAECQPEGPGLG